MNKQITLEPGGVKPPIFISVPNNGFIFLGSDISLTWQSYDLNPWKYTIFLNDTAITSGLWNSTIIISYSFRPTQSGSYNISLVVYDKFNQLSMQSVFYFVKDPNEVLTSTQNSDMPPVSFDPLFSIIVPVIFLAVIFHHKRKIKRI